MGGGGWLRWQSTLGQDPKIVRAGPWAGLAYRALLELTKAQGWEGVIHKADVDGAILARHLGWAGTEQVELRPGELHPVAEALAAGLAACAAPGPGGAGDALLLDDGDAWVLTRWRAYQLDPTAADRQRRKRARDAEERARGEGGRRPRGRHRDGITVTTVSHGDGIQGIPAEPPTATAPTRHGDKGSAELRLTADQRRTLEDAGVDLRARHGSPWVWEKAIRLLLRDGIGLEAVVAALLEEPVSLPPFLVFQRFDRALRGGRRAAAVPPRGGPGSRFAGIGKRDPVQAPGAPAGGTGE